MLWYKHPLRSSPNLSLYSEDASPKLREWMRAVSRPLANPGPTATLLLPGIPVFQVGAHTKTRPVVLSYFSRAKDASLEQQGKGGREKVYSEEDLSPLKGL